MARASLYTLRGEQNRAIADLTQAIRVVPNAPMPYYNRGYAYFARGDYDKAIADYSEAIKLNPRLAVAYNNRCLTRAVVGKDLPDALRDCDEALRLQPGNVDALDTRGFIYLKLGDYKVSINEYDGALQADAGRSRALYGRGLARVKSGDKSGEADIAAAVRKNPKVAEDFARYGVR
jgi:tetratricopeptide (TPR) repeat protein